MTRLREHYGGWRRTPAWRRPAVADHTGLKLRREVDPRGDLPPVFDQGQLGSCTANATAAAFQYDAILDGHDPGLLSRLWIYYQERSLEGELGQGDTGAMGSDAFKVASRIGVCAETDWPYDIATYAGPPPVAAESDESHYKLTKPFHAVEATERAFKAVLSNHQTVAFGFTVFESFESDETMKSGIVPMPDPQAEQPLGGHEVLLVGYLHDYPHHALVRNSWGPAVGIGGYFLFPWKLICDPMLSGDWTTIVRTLNP